MSIFPPASLQLSLFLDFIIRLQLVIDLEIFKVFEPDTAFCSLAHFLDILFDVLERVNFT